MASDEQDIAEGFDEETLGLDPAAGVDAEIAPDQWPPDRPRGLQHADADVTDESLEDRLAQEEPDVWPEASEGRAMATGDAGDLLSVELDEVNAGDEPIIGDPSSVAAEEAAIHIEDDR